MKTNADVKIMLKEAGVLFAITLVAGLLLGFVYELTKEPIRIQEEKAVQEACAAVFADADAFVEISYTLSEETGAELSATSIKIGTIYEAYDADNSLLGYVIESTSSAGYGGDITIYLGVTLEGTLNEISILDISETAGLGMKAGDVLVPQFSNKTVESFTYTKSGATSEDEIDAISGATITTKAVTNAVNGGLLAAKELREGGAKDE